MYGNGQNQPQSWPQQGQTAYNQQPYYPNQTSYGQQPVAGQPGYPPTNNSQAGYGQYQPQQTAYGQQPAYARPQAAQVQQAPGYQPFGTSNQPNPYGYQAQPGPMSYRQYGQGYVPGQQPYHAPTSYGNPYQQPQGSTAQPYPPVNNGYVQMPPQQQSSWRPAPQQNAQAGFVNQKELGYTKPERPVQPQPDPSPVSRGNAPQPHTPFDINTLLRVLLYGVVPLLFAASMLLTGVPVLKWVFIVCAVIGGITMWVHPIGASNTKLTMTIVYVALLIVALVSALIGGGKDVSRTPTAGGVVPPSSQNTTVGSEDVLFNGGYNNPVDQGVLYQETSVPASVATPVPDDDLMNNEAVVRLQSFLYFWSVNKTDEMVSLCLPSWQGTQESANTALFRILANRTPVEYTVEGISGSPNDNSRTVKITAKLDKGNGKAPSKYLLSVIMTKEDNVWYVDPRSLTTSEAAESPTPSPQPTASPTPATSSSTKLYYNPDGGSKYHADPNCSSLADKYKPLKTSFTYGQVNDKPYNKLRACNVCNAPLREN